MDKNKVYQVCPEWACDHEPIFDVKVGLETHNYCCLKGLNQSLEDFKTHLKKLNDLNENSRN